MGNAILGKLTATDIGVVVFAVLYLFERFVLIIQKIRGVKEPVVASKPITIKCPADIREALDEVCANTKVIKAAITATDEDGAPKFFVKQHLYRSVGFIKGELSDILAAIKSLEKEIKRD